METKYAGFAVLAVFTLALLLAFVAQQWELFKILASVGVIPMAALWSSYLWGSSTGMASKRAPEPIVTPIAIEKEEPKP